MTKYKCPNGSRKCASGRCAVKTNRVTPRCSKGSRKCVNGRCYSKASVIQRAYRAYRARKLTKKKRRRRRDDIDISNILTTSRRKR